MIHTCITNSKLLLVETRRKEIKIYWVNINSLFAYFIVLFSFFFSLFSLIVSRSFQIVFTDRHLYNYIRRKHLAKRFSFNYSKFVCGIWMCVAFYFEYFFNVICYYLQIFDQKKNQQLKINIQNFLFILARWIRSRTTQRSKKEKLVGHLLVDYKNELNETVRAWNTNL